MAGRLKDETVGGGELGVSLSEDDPATALGLGIQYDQGDKGFFGGGSWYLVKDDDLIGQKRNFDGSKKASIWTANLGYKFNDLLTLKGAYAQNTKADFEDKSWHAELDYGNYEDASEKGQWSVYAGYRKYGTNISFAPTEDDALRGTHGFVVGANWAPLQNIGLQAKYFDGKYNTAVGGGHGKARKIFGRVEFFF